MQFERKGGHFKSEILLSGLMKLEVMARNLKRNLLAGRRTSAMHDIPAEGLV